MPASLPSLFMLTTVGLCDALAGGLLDHETADGVTHVQTSAHFAVKWGEEWSPEAGWIEDALDDLETAYSLQVTELGFDEPDGMSIARMNVYIADSGVTMGGWELSMPDGMGGSYHVDLDGWPCILINDSFWELDAAAAATGLYTAGEWAEVSLAHEFHHTVQMAEGVYTGLEEHWWWEAMAVWAAEQQWPGSAVSWIWLLYPAARPELAVDHFDADLWLQLGTRPLTAEEEREFFHTYASFMLPVYLSDELGRPELVVAWATDDGGRAEPLDRLAELLEDESLTLDDAVVDMWGRTLSGELAGSELLPLVLEEVAVNPDFDTHSPTLILDVGAEAVEAPADRLPERYGANQLRVESPGSDLTFTLTPDAVGSAGTPARWGAAVIRCWSGSCGAELLTEGEGDESTWTVSADGADRIDLVVVPLADLFILDERFAYRVRVDPAVAETGAGCGCSSPAGASGAIFTLCMVVAVAVRRREEACPQA